MTFSSLRYACAAAGLLVLVGCANAPPTLYQWGDYQGQLYAMYNDPGKSPPRAQIEKLEADYQKARSNNKQVPPGFHAHLGYLYFQDGNQAQALTQFQTEKALYPESAKYMDRLVETLTKKPN